MFVPVSMRHSAALSSSQTSREQVDGALAVAKVVEREWVISRLPWFTLESSRCSVHVQPIALLGGGWTGGCTEKYCLKCRGEVKSIFLPLVGLCHILGEQCFSVVGNFICYWPSM